MEDFLHSMDSSIFTAIIEINYSQAKKKKKCNEEFNLLVCDTHLKKRFKDRKNNEKEKIKPKLFSVLK